MRADNSDFGLKIMAQHFYNHRLRISNPLVRSCAIAVTLLVSAVLPAAAVAAESLLVSGPVESVDSAHQTVVILGQSVRLSAQTRLYFGSLGDSKNAVRVDQRIRRLLDAGRLVAVWSIDGTSAGTVLISGDRFVPGSTPVYLTGVVTVVDQLRGYAAVGNAQIDLTAALYQGSLDLAVGDTVQVLGTQPAPAGVILASDYRVVRPSGIGGSSTSGIGGSSTSGIGGSSTSGT